PARSEQLARTRTTMLFIPAPLDRPGRAPRPGAWTAHNLSAPARMRERAWAWLKTSPVPGSDPGSRLLEPAPAQERPLALPPTPLPVPPQHLSSLDHHLGPPPHPKAFVARVVHVHVVCRGRQRALSLRVEHHDVRIRPRGDGPLARVQPMQASRPGGHQVH